jgi:hypothetical protein
LEDDPPLSGWVKLFNQFNDTPASIHRQRKVPQTALPCTAMHSFQKVVDHDA